MSRIELTGCHGENQETKKVGEEKKEKKKKNQQTKNKQLKKICTDISDQFQK